MSNFRHGSRRILASNSIVPGGSEILKEEEEDVEHGFKDITTDLIRDWQEHSEFK